MGPVPRVGDLRERVRIERRYSGVPETPFGDEAPYGDETLHDAVASEDGYGNNDTDWITLIANRAARLAPARGGEKVIAARLQGTAPWDVWLRRDPQTAAITEGDRIVDVLTGRILAIRFVGNLDERGRFLLLQCEAGHGSD
jgi:head-tail adaptor